MTLKNLRKAFHEPEFVGMLLAIGLAYLSFFVTPFVVMSLWNWFVSPAIHGGEISYVQAIGFLVLLYVTRIQIYTSADENWGRLFTVLEAILPEHASGKAREAIKEGKGSDWKGDLGRTIGKLIAYALILALGWGLHTFLM